MSEYIEPGGEERQEGGSEFPSALTAEVDPFEFEGKQYSTMKFVYLSKEDAQPFTEKQIPGEGIILVGPQETMDHWMIVSENLNPDLTREQIREITVNDAGEMMKQDEGQVIIPLVTASGELKTSDGEMARMDMDSLRKAHTSTVEALNKIYETSDHKYNFSLI